MMVKNITVRLDDAVKYKSSSSLSYFINFDYSEYFVNTLKNYMPKRFYHADTKTWEVPAMYKDQVNAWIDKIESVNKVNRPTADTVTPEILSNFKPTCAVDLKSIKMPKVDAKVPLFPHQQDVIKFGIAKNSFLLGDEMGLGKTASVIHYALYMRDKYKYKHCLVIAGINGLKWNWLHEIEKHSNEKGWVLGMKSKKKQAHVFEVKSNKDVINDLNILPNFYFLIINIEKVRDANISKRLIKLINAGEINMVVLDECQVVKNFKAQQTKRFLELRPETRIAVTGTPIMNNPIELWGVFNWLGIDNHSYYEFRNHHAVFGGYMDKQIVAYKNIDEIQAKLQACMLRRLTSDVIDLPERIENYEYLEMNTKQWAIYDEIRNELLSQIDKIKLQPNPLVELIRLRQATAWTGLLSTQVDESIKFERLLQIAHELTANDKKFIVFSNWANVINRALEVLKDFKPALVTGQVSDTHREHEIAMFKHDKACRCILGTTKALGTGYTLTEATTVIFLDEPWNAATKDQAMKRAHRIGSTETVNIITLLCAGTIDERIAELVYKKGAISQAIVDMDPHASANIDKVIDYLIK